MNNLLSKYQKEIVPKLKEEFKLENDLSVPRIEKIVLNMGLAEALSSKDVTEKAMDQLSQIASQKPSVRKARESISNFKLRKGDPIGLTVTLRGKKAWHFFEKLIAIVLPRMRDFRGIPETKFDKAGNYSLGITEQIIFPEIEYSKVDKLRGLVATIVVKHSDPDKSKKLFELLGVPFRKS